MERTTQTAQLPDRLVEESIPFQSATKRSFNSPSLSNFAPYTGIIIELEVSNHDALSAY